MDLFDTIGNGVGAICFFSPSMLDGSYLTTTTLTAIDTIAGGSYQGSAVAQALGVYENRTMDKSFFYSKIREQVLPKKTGFDFLIDIYYNSTMSQLDILEYIRAGNMNEFILLAETIKIDDSVDTEGFFEKLVG